MNTPKTSKKNIVIIVIIIIAAIIGYFYYEGSAPVTNSSLQTTAASDDAQAVGARVLALLNQIRHSEIILSLSRRRMSVARILSHHCPECRAHRRLGDRPQLHYERNRYPSKKEASFK